MAIVHLTEASASAPRLSGTNGDLCLVLDWALVQNGWTIDFSSGNKRCYRPGSGNRFILYVEHDSATSGNAGLAVVRGAESQSAGTLTDPFPTVALVANSNCNWLVSSAASTTARNFDIYLGTTFIIMCTNFSGATNVWEVHFWGDIPPTLAGDSYNTIAFNRNSTSTGSPVFYGRSVNSFAGNTNWWWARSYDGTVKSSSGAPLSWTNAAIGAAANLPLPQGGPSGAIDSRVMAVVDSGSTTGTGTAATGLPIRGWLPQFREPLHSGSGTGVVQTRTTYTDTGFNASSSFNPFRSSNTSLNFVIIEEDNFWTPPS